MILVDFTILTFAEPSQPPGDANVKINPLGLTPRQHSTGGKTKLLGISKRGNGYLRKQLIHGARAAMPHLAAKPNQMGAWLQNMLARAHPNVVVVALAAKLARIAWAVLRHEEDFDQREPVAA